MCTAFTHCGDLATPPPTPPGIWAHIRGRYWSAKIDDISLWPPALISPQDMFIVQSASDSTAHEQFFFTNGWKIPFHAHCSGPVVKRRLSERRLFSHLFANVQGSYLGSDLQYVAFTYSWLKLIIQTHNYSNHLRGAFFIRKNTSGSVLWSYFCIFGSP
jgi:hypothetical protein